MACVSPSSVRGCIRSSKMSRIIAIERVCPIRPRHQVQPDVVGPCLAQAASQTSARSGVPVFVGAAGDGDLIGRHRGVADEDRPVVGQSGEAGPQVGVVSGPAAVVVAPDAFIDAVVEMKCSRCLNSARAAENSSSTSRECSSMLPPASRNSSTLTALWRSGRVWTSI